METEITGVLLAGGKSRRMGTDKREISLNGQTLFERALSVLQQVFSEVVVVLAQHDFSIDQPGVRVVIDRIPNCATAGGLYTGLYYATKSKIFVVACDMPFLNPRAIFFLNSLSKNFDMTLVQLSTGIQPMHAVYSKKCLPILENMIKTDNLRLQDIVNDPTLSIRIVPESEIQSHDPQLLTFLNLNSPEDLEFARKMTFIPKP